MNLEAFHVPLLNENQELKEELKKQVIINKNSKSCADLKKNLNNLNSIFHLISNLQRIGKKFMLHEPVNLVDLMQNDDSDCNKSVGEILQIIRKEIYSLRMLVSDIYAENYGNSCETY